jgi:two-component sensor histidine kinase
VNVEQGQAVGFIMHELALNCVKYAWDEDSDKKLNVDISKENDTVKITCKDNGKGLPPTFNIETVKSMGLKLVRSFTKRQLKGDIRFSSDNGTTVELSFIPRA